MNRKTFFIVLGLLIIIGIIVFWFLFRKKQEEVKQPPTETEKPCLIFQFEDPLKPCYVKPITKPATTTPGVVLLPCDLLNTIERDDCIFKSAISEKDPNL